jgi:hypothetical protein
MHLNVWLCLNLKNLVSVRHHYPRYLHLTLFSIMKWTNPEFVEILSRALNDFEEADADGRNGIVTETKKQIRKCGKVHNLEVPKLLTNVCLTMKREQAPSDLFAVESFELVQQSSPNPSQEAQASKIYKKMEFSKGCPTNEEEGNPLQSNGAFRR